MRKLDAAWGRKRTGDDTYLYDEGRLAVLYPDMTEGPEGVFDVPSSKGTGDVHSVDMINGCCTCPLGRQRRLCPHQLAIAMRFPERFASMFAVNADLAARRLYSEVAFGAQCPAVVDEAYFVPPGRAFEHFTSDSNNGCMEEDGLVPPEVHGSNNDHSSADHSTGEASPALSRPSASAGGASTLTPHTTRRLSALSSSMDESGGGALASLIRGAVKVLQHPNFNNAQQGRQVSKWLQRLERETGKAAAEVHDMLDGLDAASALSSAFPANPHSMLRTLHTTCTSRMRWSKASRKIKEKKTPKKAFVRGKGGRKKRVLAKK